MRRVGGLFLFAILAGFCIGLGGTVFLRLRDAFPGGNVVGALLFTIGLFTICTRGYALFTGKACYLFENPWPGYLLDLLIIWVATSWAPCSSQGLRPSPASWGRNPGSTSPPPLWWTERWGTVT